MTQDPPQGSPVPCARVVYVFRLNGLLTAAPISHTSALRCSAD